MAAEPPMGENERGRANFGPFESLQALTDLQRQGIKAATEVASRFTSLLDVGPQVEDDKADGSSRPQDGPNPTGTGDAPAGPETVAEMRATVSRLVDVYSNLLERTFDSYLDMVEQRTGLKGAHLNGGNTDTAFIELEPGQEGSTDLWIENPTADASPTMTPQASDLHNVGGHRIAGSSIKLDPPVVEKLDPESTAHLVMTLAVDASTPAGYYHGHVLVPEMPGEVLPVTVLVTGHSATDDASAS